MNEPLTKKNSLGIVETINFFPSVTLTHEVKIIKTRNN